MQGRDCVIGVYDGYPSIDTEKGGLRIFLASLRQVVVEIALFNERNPLPDIARFTLGPRCGQAWVSTRIRLGDTQSVHALARMNDGAIWSASAELIVTLPACIEG